MGAGRIKQIYGSSSQTTIVGEGTGISVNDGGYLYATTTISGTSTSKVFIVGDLLQIWNGITVWPGGKIYLNGGTDNTTLRVVIWGYASTGIVHYGSSMPVLA